MTGDPGDGQTFSASLVVKKKKTVMNTNSSRAEKPYEESEIERRPHPSHTITCGAEHDPSVLCAFMCMYTVCV